MQNIPFRYDATVALILIITLISSLSSLLPVYANLYVNGVGYSVFAPLEASTLRVDSSFTLAGVDVGSQLHSLAQQLSTLSSNSDSLADLITLVNSQTVTLQQQADLLTQLQSDIISLKQENKGLQANFTAATTQISVEHAARMAEDANLQSQIDALSSEVEVANQQAAKTYASVQAQMNSMNISITSLQQKTDTQQADITAIAQINDDQQTDLDSINEQIADVPTLAAETRASIAATEASVAVQAATLAVMTSVNSTNVAGMVAVLQVRVDAHATQLMQLDAANSGQAEILNYHDTEITNLQSGLASAQTSISDHTSQLTSFQSTYASQAASITTLLSNVASVQRLASLSNSSIATLTDGLASQSAALSSLTLRVTTAETSISSNFASSTADSRAQSLALTNIGASLQVTNNSVAALAINLASGIATVQSAIAVLSSRINTTDATARSLDARVTAVEGSLLTLTARVNSINMSSASSMSSVSSDAVAALSLRVTNVESAVGCILSANVTTRLSVLESPPDIHWIGTASGLGTTLISPWLPYDGIPPGFSMDSSGMVRFYGLVRSGLVNSTIFVLPLSFRPTTALFFSADAGKQFGEIVIEFGTGNVVFRSGLAIPGWVSLDSISFYAATSYLPVAPTPCTSTSIPSFSGSGTSDDGVSSATVDSLVSRMNAAESMLAALNHTGEWQTSLAVSGPTSTIRLAWVSNPALAPLTIQRAGVYVLLAQARLGGCDATDSLSVSQLHFKHSNPV